MSYTPDPMTTPRAPYDRFTARKGDGVGGRDARGTGREIVPGLVDGQIRGGRGWYAGDDKIVRDRIPYYDRDYMTGSCDTLVNWTQCGPVRPSLHMRQSTTREMVGTSATRNFDPFPIRGYGSQDQGHGMHTNPQPTKRLTNARYANTTQMQPARVGRLMSARYSGQSFSQTTRVQGG
jgi:hypothetical protein